MQHVVIRREDYVAGSSERPEVGVFTQTHVSKLPTPWGRISIGDIVWMKWSGGPIIAKSVVQGFRQLQDTSPSQLRETTRGFRLYQLDDYWESLKPGFNAVTIYLEQEEWLDDIIEPKARSYGDSWVVLDDESTDRWLTSKTSAHSPVQELPTKGAKPRKSPISASQRFRILRRDGFSCVYCGRSPQNDGVQLHVDHVIPRVSDGSNDDGNLVAACRDCNLGKGVTLLTS